MPAGAPSRRLPIRAGGAVVTRSGIRGPEVLLIHRPRYNDWSIPKGKNHAGESTPAAAVREVAEETGVTVRLGVPLDELRYQTSKGPKVVQYWGGTVLAEVKRAPDDEVDVVSWLPVKQALARLTYPHDRELAAQRLEQPPTTPLVVVRHAKAMDRSDWTKIDNTRPLAAKGRKQAAALVEILAAFGVQSVYSSAATRCVQTMQPYAAAHGQGITRFTALTEDEGIGHPKRVRRLVQTISEDVGRLAQPAAVCGHRPVLPEMLAALGLADRPFRTAECAVAHLTADGDTHAVEWHRPEV